MSTDVHRTDPSTDVSSAGVASTGGLAAEDRGGVPRPLLLTLALLAAVAPLSTDLYLPSFPQLASDLGTTETGAQLTLTMFLIGLAAGQLVFGPLSDRLGRRRPLLAGVVLCIAAGVVAVAAPTLWVLALARLVQGLAGSAGMVLGRAVITDLTRGRVAAQALSLMMIVGGVAPVLGPSVGGLLAGPLGWRGLLGIVLALTVLMLVTVLAFVPESFPAEQRAAERAAAADRPSAWQALASRRFVGYTLAFALGFSVMMTYISASPFLYQDQMGLSEAAYGLVFGVNALALVVVSAISARLVAVHPVRRLLTVGLTLVLVACLVLLALVLADVPAGWFALPIFVAVGSLGLVMGNGTALAMSAVPHARGSASAVLGALQFGLGGVVSVLSGLGEGAIGQAVVMAACAVAAVLALALAGRAPLDD
ncbi:multidrug effflux MFS transporter [Nocardioides bruguierae]|uniref:multidrug effflux MFS transporter n=1 Tax=Nocardioides bruguierae TaxID=2945102 RepID=UPI0020217663|nr:multidrug effflux MFS transporter [Nocardioides bruguierae]MCL8025985.1 multidrug effflux MFS transporter [Nocardioides bruguierae]